MSLYPPPQVVDTTVFTTMPTEFRRTGRESAWSRANRTGEAVDCFIEGPAFDRAGNLFLVDIPWGRIFKISSSGDWKLLCEYDGWPNGLKIHRDGRLFVTDYYRGIMVVDPESGKLEHYLTHRYSESFRGVNDLVFASDGALYFTDQGQSGLHKPDGRVFRISADGKLDCLIDNAPSPNGLVLNHRESILYVAMTRANAIWRLPLMHDGGVSKVGLFVQLSGGLGGPDGMALDDEDRLLVAHAGAGAVWVFDSLGKPIYKLQSCSGLSTTNLAFGGMDNKQVFITESASGDVLSANLDVAGKPMYSHA